LLPVFNAGAAGIRAAMTEAEALGIALSRTDVAKVQAMNDAFARVKAAVMGVGTSLAASVAPVVEAVVKRIADFAAASGGVGPIVTRAFAAAAEGVALFADGLSVISRSFSKLEENLLRGLGRIVKGYVQLFKVAAALDPSGVFEQAALGASLLANGLTAQAEKIKVNLEKSIGAPSLGKAVRDSFAQIIADAEAAAKAAADVAAKAQAGGGSIAGPADLAKLSDLQQKLAAATFAQAIKPAAAPKGVKAIADKAAEPTAGPAAIERGSREAFSLINARQNKGIDKAVDLLAKLLLVSEKQAAAETPELAVVTL
jgi:hypothetical protein